MKVSMGKSSMVDLKKSPVCLPKGKFFVRPRISNDRNPVVNIILGNWSRLLLHVLAAHVRWMH